MKKGKKINRGPKKKQSLQSGKISMRRRLSFMILRKM